MRVGDQKGYHVHCSSLALPNLDTTASRGIDKMDVIVDDEEVDVDKTEAGDNMALGDINQS
jgi:hypothetical protein